jgi:hypothetical protein
MAQPRVSRRRTSAPLPRSVPPPWHCPPAKTPIDSTDTSNHCLYGFSGEDERANPKLAWPIEPLNQAPHLHSASFALKAMSQLGRGCVKTPTHFPTDLFRSLLRGFKALRIEKIARSSALLDPLQNFAAFSHGLGRKRHSNREVAHER